MKSNFTKFFFKKDAGTVGGKEFACSRKDCSYYIIESKYCAYHNCICYGPNTQGCRGMYTKEKVYKTFDIERQHLPKIINNNTTAILENACGEIIAVQVNTFMHPEHKALLGKREKEKIIYKGEEYYVKKVR